MNKNITCLYIDDDIEDQQFFQDAIKTIIHSVKCFLSFNGKDALNRLTTGEYKPDVIFLDLKMPFMDGLQFLSERIKYGSLRHIPVYVLTDYFYETNRMRALSLGAKDFIVKPFVVADWQQCLKKVLNDLL